MSDETKQNPAAEPLQFDTAEPVVGASETPTSLACTACTADITASYYEVNGSIVCLSCRAKLREQLTGGSRWKRFGKATGFGLIAAVVGSALYYGVGALTGYHIGLVALVVGFLVGRAVNLGSGQRGGRAYQILAVGLTYFAIASTYIPEIVKTAREAVATAADSSAKAMAEKSVSTNAGPQVELQGSPSVGAAGVHTSSLARSERTLGQHVLGILALLALAALVPIFAGFESIIFLVILGFTLFEAWRQNRRLDLAITGPYRIGESRDGQPSVVPTGG